MGTRIVRTEVWEEDLQLTRQYRIAGEQITYAENAFVLLHSADGSFGIGSACPMPEVCGESMQDTLDGLKKGSDLIKNVEITDPLLLSKTLQQELSQTPAAFAAIDMALYDQHCKRLNVPIVDFLGRKHLEMATSVTIGITTDFQVHEELLTHLRQGFQVIKVKIGDDLERDIAIVSKLREWGGNQFRLRVDANEGYDLISLTRFLSQTSAMNIELIEQPLLSPAAEQMRTLTAIQRENCMADEDLLTELDAQELTRNKPYGVWNIKLMKSGGITPAKRIAAVASQAGISVMWGCNDESRVSIAAALHAAFSCAATKYLDLDGSFDIARDLVDGGFIVENGKLRLTDKPGLGVLLL